MMIKTILIMVSREFAVPKVIVWLNDDELGSYEEESSTSSHGGLVDALECLVLVTREIEYRFRCFVKVACVSRGKSTRLSSLSTQEGSETNLHFLLLNH